MRTSATIQHSPRHGQRTMRLAAQVGSDDSDLKILPESNHRSVSAKFCLPAAMVLHPNTHTQVTQMCCTECAHQTVASINKHLSRRLATNGLHCATRRVTPMTCVEATLQERGNHVIRTLGEILATTQTDIVRNMRVRTTEIKACAVTKIHCGLAQRPHYTKDCCLACCHCGVGTVRSSSTVRRLPPRAPRGAQMNGGLC